MLAEQGYLVKVCKGWKEAVGLTIQYLDREVERCL